MSFLDMYQGDRAADDQRILQTSGKDLPAGVGEEFAAHWNTNQLFSQDLLGQNDRTEAISDYIDQIKQQTGKDITQQLDFGGPESGAPDLLDQVNGEVEKINQARPPDQAVQMLSAADIEKRAVAKRQQADANLASLDNREQTFGSRFGALAGSVAAGIASPVNLIALPIAPEAEGVSLVANALRWGVVGGGAQAVSEAAGMPYQQEVHPGYAQSGAPFTNIAEAAAGAAVLGGATRFLGNAWTRAKTGAWPTSIKDAGNVVESEANILDHNVYPDAEGEAAHRDAMATGIDQVLKGEPVDVSKIITPDIEAGAFDAYHGSPHDFEAFDLGKIGSGEGAQAYGHGLYFAEKPEVAAAYRRSTDGLTPLDTNMRAAQDAVKQYGSRENAVDELSARLDRISKGPLRDEGNEKFLSTLIETLKKGDIAPEGNVYSVRISRSRDDFLDWDKPINLQSQPVQDALQKLGIDQSIATDGADAYRQLVQMNSRRAAPDETGMRREVGQHDVSRTLNEAGIAGIRYLDQGSRDGGDGTRNFVVFNDKDVRITHKNGIQQPVRPAEVPSFEPTPKPDVAPPDQVRQMVESSDHEAALQSDIEREQVGEVGRQIPVDVDKDGNVTFRSIDDMANETEAYRKVADQIAACAAPAPEEPTNG